MRKKISKMAGITALFGLLSIFVLYLFWSKDHLWRGELMSIKRVCKRWGEAPLNVKKFKEAEDYDKKHIRAKMACSLIRDQNKYIGMDRGDIRRLFGNFTGHYFSDMYPTYIIGNGQENDNDSWQILFFIDGDEKVSKIAVHKNCCDASVQKIRERFSNIQIN